MNTPAQYSAMFNSMQISLSKEAVVATIAGKISANKARYVKVVSASPRPWTMPWYIVGIIHSMESSLDFTRHLHNGDPLSDRTTHEPAGRPVKGIPPFLWEESAIDALQMRGLDKVSDWSVSHTLLEIEGYNGFGYSRHGVQSPYLWAGSNYYGTPPNIGKYVADGTFKQYDAAGKPILSKQIGAALLLKQFIF